METKQPVALVTGASGGIGFEASAALAGKGFHVVMGCRDRARGEAAVRAVQDRSGGTAELLLLDLDSFESIRRAAKEARSRHPQLDVLLNNAGLWTRTRETTRDGFERTLGVNHLGHFLLTKLLWDCLKPGARVVNVSSGAHIGARWDWDDVWMEKRWRGIRAYANSKLANVWFTTELSRRLPAGVTANAVHPGGIATNIFRAAPAPIRILLDLVLPSAEKGARPLVRLCADEDVSGVTGRYFNRMKEKAASPAARDDAAARRLWDLSEKAVG